MPRTIEDMVSSIRPEEILTRLEPEERRWVEEFRDRVRSEFGQRLKDLRIFGSKVRGDVHPESDIDLLVLVEDLSSDEWKRIGRMSSAISSWLSPVVEDFERYHAPINRASGFYKEMRKESVRL